MFDSIKGIIGDLASGTVKDQRIALSQEQLTALDAKLKVLASELSEARSRISGLERENADLNQQLQHTKPVRKLSKKEQSILLILAREGAGLTVEEVAHSIGEISSVAHHHCDELQSLGFIEQVRFRGEHRRIEGPDWGFALTKKGRKWIAEQSA
jgi:DNA-binding MarR family transcriptional regulator